MASHSASAAGNAQAGNIFVPRKCPVSFPSVPACSFHLWVTVPRDCSPPWYPLEIKGLCAQRGREEKWQRAAPHLTFGSHLRVTDKQQLVRLAGSVLVGLETLPVHRLLSLSDSAPTGFKSPSGERSLIKDTRYAYRRVPVCTHTPRTHTHTAHTHAYAYLGKHTYANHTHIHACISKHMPCTHRHTHIHKPCTCTHMQ